MPTMHIRKKILLLGSSMTQRSFQVEHQGWGAQLSNWYVRSADVLNRGASGYNSRWTLRFIKQSFANDKPDMTILFIGNNDAIEEGEKQHVSLEEYRQNILGLLEYFGSINRHMIVLLVSPTPCLESIRPKHNNERRNRYADILRDLIDRKEDLFSHCLIPRNIHFLDCMQAYYQQHTLHIDPELDLLDGMHFNSNGNSKFFQMVKQCMNNHLPHLSPDFLATSHSQSKRIRSDSWNLTNFQHHLHKKMAHNNNNNNNNNNNIHKHTNQHSYNNTNNNHGLDSAEVIAASIMDLLEQYDDESHHHHYHIEVPSTHSTHSTIDSDTTKTDTQYIAPLHYTVPLRQWLQLEVKLLSHSSSSSSSSSSATSIMSASTSPTTVTSSSSLSSIATASSSSLSVSTSEIETEATAYTGSGSYTTGMIDDDRYERETETEDILDERDDNTDHLHTDNSSIIDSHKHTNSFTNL
jgi:lysophospholipase L1-like esterase